MFVRSWSEPWAVRSVYQEASADRATVDVIRLSRLVGPDVFALQPTIANPYGYTQMKNALAGPCGVGRQWLGLALLCPDQGLELRRDSTE